MAAFPDDRISRHDVPRRDLVHVEDSEHRRLDTIADTPAISDGEGRRERNARTPKFEAYEFGE